jgi:hypothetical protein
MKYSKQLKTKDYRTLIAESIIEHAISDFFFFASERERENGTENHTNENTAREIYIMHGENVVG